MIMADADARGGALPLTRANYWRGYANALFDSGRIDGMALAAATVRISAITAPADEALENDGVAGSGGALWSDVHDPYLLELKSLGQRLSIMLDPDEVVTVIAQTLSMAIQASYVAVYLRRSEGKEDELVAEYSPGMHAMLQNFYEFPFMHDDEIVGNMLVGVPESAGALSLAARAEVEDFARCAGGALAAVRLVHELQRAREQMVFSREEERKLLRRDLHDTIGPTLAALSMQANAIRKLIDTDPKQAQTLVAEMRQQIRNVIGDIRRVVENLRPPALDDFGLVSAVEEQAIRFSVDGFRVTVDCPDRLPQLNAAVEVAAYRIVLEALTNVARHANAKNCWIRFRRDTDALHVEIQDDGSGLKTKGGLGIGVNSMRQRAAELGGECQFQSGEGMVPIGTLVRASLPLMPTSSVTIDLGNFSLTTP